MSRGVYPYLSVAQVRHGHFGGNIFQQKFGIKPSYFSIFIYA